MPDADEKGERARGHVLLAAPVKGVRQSLVQVAENSERRSERRRVGGEVGSEQ